MAAHLLTTRRFAPLFWCQFFSAFNDNFLKNALVILILFRLGGGLSVEMIAHEGAMSISQYYFE
jgi:acyl-[acyl-carrier-protein]-phospholipid O-acyltransferase / long-chain-fatty-acid--[acyl-carrier-protein] ligase